MTSLLATKMSLFNRHDNSTFRLVETTYSYAFGPVMRNSHY